MEIWCAHQSTDENGTVCCLAHLHEDRVFRCPYESNEARLQSKYPCADYRSFTEAVDCIIKELAHVYQVPEKLLRGEGLWIYHL